MVPVHVFQVTVEETTFGIEPPLLVHEVNRGGIIIVEGAAGNVFLDPHKAGEKGIEEIVAIVIEGVNEDGFEVPGHPFVRLVRELLPFLPIDSVKAFGEERKIDFLILEPMIGELF